MGTSSRRATIAVLLACICGLAACGGSSEPPPQEVSAPLLRYERGVRLDPDRSPRAREGTLRVSRISYRSVDGDRVPALLAVPTHARPLGCVIVQGGLTTPKEATADLRQALAVARLASFTIDPRDVGERGSPEELAAAISSPEGLRALLVATVVELRLGVDYLSRRRICRDNIAFMGSAFGSMAGVILTAQDRRIKSALLSSVGATFEQALLARPLAAERVPNLPNYVPTATADPAALEHAVDVLSPYDSKRWIGRIAPRPVMLMNGRFDPTVLPGDAMELVAAARRPKTLLYYDGGPDPFAEGPARDLNLLRAGRFLVETMDLPFPTS
ncbi:alpha/beta hydrolase [Svornostia abyssi]|uniref:Alpha/beta hydrolase n=1 Tax=Svornostia abyssi TaxID=2898438 RepID=A0ABY5PK07_9ACTN|nr:alpha/beta hydrolase [Parviterribacteraceae bacterium J379]